MSINKELEKLYRPYWDKALERITEDKLELSNPLLIKIDEKEYETSNVKIMIFGQETFGWNGQFGSENMNVERLMDDYFAYLHYDEQDDSYFHGLNDDYRTSKRRIKGKKKRAFWKAFKYFEKEIKLQLHNIHKPYFIWNNIAKISKNDQKGMDDKIRKFTKENFSTVLEEIKILKPDMVIFLTGPNRDGDIKHYFKDVAFDYCGYPEKIKDKKTYKSPQKVISKYLPEKSIRLYHPSYFGGFNKVKQIAIDILKNS